MKRIGLTVNQAVVMASVAAQAIDVKTDAIIVDEVSMKDNDLRQLAKQEAAMLISNYESEPAYPYYHGRKRKLKKPKKLFRA